MKFYCRYAGDYLRDTGHLTLLQHAVYTLLLDHYYARDSDIVSSEKLLSKLVRASTKKEREAVRFVVDTFFPLGPDGKRHNARADREIAKWQRYCAKQKEASKLGVEARRAATERSTERLTDRSTNGSPERSTLPSPYPDLSVVLPTSSLKTTDSPPGDPPPEAAPSSFQFGTESKLEKAGDDPRGTLFAKIRAAYPAGTYQQADWLNAEHNVAHIIDNGLGTWDDLLHGAERYAAQCKAMNRPKQYVMSPRKMFDTARRFLDPFPLPDPEKARRPTFDELHREMQARLTPEELREMKDLPF